ncbi:MAG: GWxTD domain-containing protein [Ignavibacteria bacterium]|nr:GWxTD domain-containing protein [Ignavibacteria bacterium]
MKFISALFIFFTGLLFSQPEIDKKNFPYSVTPDFFIDAVPYKSAEAGKTRMDIFIQLPYSNLQFIKSGEKYVAEYSANIIIYNEDKSLMLDNQNWNQKIVTEDFYATSSRGSFSLSLKSFNLAPGNYYGICQVTDKESKKNFKYENILFVPQLNDSLSLSGILLIQKRITDSNGKTRIMPNISGEVSSNIKTLPFMFEINSNKSRNVFLKYTIKNDQEEVFQKVIPEKLDSGRNNFSQDIENLNFNLGNYKLFVELRNERDSLISSISKSFHSQIFGFPSTVNDLDKAIDQMVYIASGSEYAEIKAAETYDEKMKRFTDYWEKIDPSPNTLENEILNEYYRRVEYANKNFGSYFGGWRSDMGMIYITLGPPNNIERHPFDYDSKPYEKWEYFNLNRTFIFVDYSGFGDYRLINADYGEWMRYRQ